jgi:hypothetical protein
MVLFMRISTMPGDHYYREDIANFVVLLDGKLVQGSTVISADEEKGEVRSILFDEHGNIRHDGENIVIRRLSGRVKIMTTDSYARATTSGLLSTDRLSLHKDPP